MRGDLKVVVSAKWLRSYFRPDDMVKIRQAAETAKAIPLLAYKVYDKKDIKKRKGVKILEICKGNSLRVKGVTLALEPLAYYENHILKDRRLEDWLEKASAQATL